MALLLSLQLDQLVVEVFDDKGLRRYGFILFPKYLIHLVQVDDLNGLPLL